MYLIRQVYNGIENLDDMYVYKYMGHEWQLKQLIKIRDRKSLIKLLDYSMINFDYAILKFNQPYRNTFYYLYPQIKIIIDKEEVIELFNTIMSPQVEAYEEVAVLIERPESFERINREGHSFIYDFYSMRSKLEAIKYYEVWQTYMPLNDKKVSRFIRIMEFYFDEIINYFERPQIINKLNKKTTT